MRTVENLDVYRKAYEASLRTHHITQGFPSWERYRGLGSQLRSSSKSVVANLVEGYCFKNIRPGRFLSHLEVSMGSCDETRLWLRYCLDLNYIEEALYRELELIYSEIGRMLWGLFRSLEPPSLEP